MITELGPAEIPLRPGIPEGRYNLQASGIRRQNLCTAFTLIPRARWSPTCSRLFQPSLSACYSAISPLRRISTLLFVHDPIYRAAFSGSKEPILRNVAENSFTSMALPDALVTVRFLRLDNSSDNDRYDHQQRLVFVVRLIREMKATQQRSPTLSESIELCRFPPSFAFFIQDCTRRFLTTAEREGGHRNKAMTAKIGSSEE